jgi:O-antigen biosynthesis protein WbqP
MYASITKRILDIIFALTALLLVFPVGIIIAIVIKLESKGPILFRQQRIGKDAKIFVIYKFRSMRTDAPKLPPNKFKNVNIYITKSGAILRKTSLDELPQLFNVLKGDMSIIGPRPGAAQNEDELIIERQKYGVFQARPGITGWAQVNGRDELAASVPHKVAYDSEYIENMGILMDLKCLYKTILTVLKSDGYNEGVVSNEIKQPRITTNPKTVFYAKVSSQTGKIQTRSVFRRKDHIKLEENG